MKKLPVVTLAFPILLALGGCGKGPQDRLQGKWAGVSIDNIPAEQEARAGGWIKGTTFSFKGSKVTISIPAEEPRTGDFKVAKVNGNRLTLEVFRANGDADEAVVVLADEKTMRWEIGNERAITLRRAALDLRALRRFPKLAGCAAPSAGTNSKPFRVTTRRIPESCALRCAPQHRQKRPPYVFGDAV
jgi:hypothetical protein